MMCNEEIRGLLRSARLLIEESSEQISSVGFDHRKAMTSKLQIAEEELVSVIGILASLVDK